MARTRTPDPLIAQDTGFGDAVALTVIQSETACGGQGETNHVLGFEDGETLFETVDDFFQAGGVHSDGPRFASHPLCGAGFGTCGCPIAQLSMHHAQA